LSPAGKHHLEDLYSAGGVEAVMNELYKNDLLNGKTMTVTGKNTADNISGADIRNTEVIHTVAEPYLKDGGLAILFGNLAPNRMCS